jgi:hypothetical protein
VLHSRDHILRIIEQLSREVARVLDGLLRDTGREVQAGEALERVATQAGLDLELARRLAPESLHLMIERAGEVSPEHCWLLAEILYVDGVRASGAGNAALAERCFRRARYLYCLVRPEWSTAVPLPAAPDRLSDLELRLAGRVGE